MPFAVPMIWREPRNHVDDCYFCIVNISGFSSKNKQSIQYPNLDSTRRPVKHDEWLPIPCPPDYNLEYYNYLPDSEDEEMEYTEDLPTQSSSNDPEYNYTCTDSEPKLFNQKKLHDLIRDLNLSKEKSEILASRLKENNLLGEDVKISYYRKRNFDLKEYFSVDDLLCFYHDTPGLFSSMAQPYNTSDWRLLIDSSQMSFKAVLLHNGYILASIPNAHSVHLKETYENTEILMKAIKYEG